MRTALRTHDSNPAALAWSKSVMALIDALQKYVKQWHTTGVVWNPNVRIQPIVELIAGTTCQAGCCSGPRCPQ